MTGCAWATVVAYFISSVGFAVLLHVKTSIPVSWVFLALLPNLCGAVALTLTGSIFIALAVGLGLSVLVMVVKWRSIKDGIEIVKRIL